MEIFSNQNSTNLLLINCFSRLFGVSPIWSTYLQEILIVCLECNQCGVDALRILSVAWNWKGTLCRNEHEHALCKYSDKQEKKRCYFEYLNLRNGKRKQRGKNQLIYVRHGHWVKGNHLNNKACRTINWSIVNKPFRSPLQMIRLGTDTGIGTGNGKEVIQSKQMFVRMFFFVCFWYSNFNWLYLRYGTSFCLVSYLVKYIDECWYRKKGNDKQEQHLETFEQDHVYVIRMYAIE